MSEPTFVIERRFAAPRDLVWRCFTEPELIARWMAPGGTTHVLEFEPAPGGVNFSMTAYGEGVAMYGKDLFEELRPPERLVFRHMFADADGEPTRHPMEPNWPLVLRTVIELEEHGAETLVRLSWTPVDALPHEIAVFAENMDSMHGGWTGSFDNLDALLAEGEPTVHWTVAGTLQIRKEDPSALVLTRRFAAPPARVFAAFTEPDLIRRWMLGPGDEWTMPVCELDLRPGGSMRYEWQGSGGDAMGLSGTFVEVHPPHRVVHRERFDEDWTGGETTVTSTFEQDGDGTKHTMRIDYASVEARDGAFGSGMGWGMETGYRKLDEALA